MYVFCSFNKIFTFIKNEKNEVNLSKAWPFNILLFILYLFLGQIAFERIHHNFYTSIIH